MVRHSPPAALQAMDADVFTARIPIRPLVVAGADNERRNRPPASRAKRVLSPWSKGEYEVSYSSFSTITTSCQTPSSWPCFS
jgi:hypothetical protein